jgi:hypothetical protein
MTYQALPIETHTLGELALDLDNYRIPVRKADENAALNYLYAEEDVFETAKMIIRDGYFDNEVPIVVADGKRYTVLETSPPSRVGIRAYGSNVRAPVTMSLATSTESTTDPTRGSTPPRVRSIARSTTSTGRLLAWLCC